MKPRHQLRLASPAGRRERDTTSARRFDDSKPRPCGRMSRPLREPPRVGFFAEAAELHRPVARRRRRRLRRRRWRGPAARRRPVRHSRAEPRRRASAQVLLPQAPLPSRRTSGSAAASLASTGGVRQVAWRPAAPPRRPTREHRRPNAASACASASAPRPTAIAASRRGFDAALRTVEHPGNQPHPNRDQHGRPDESLLHTLIHVAGRSTNGEGAQYSRSASSAAPTVWNDP